MEKNIFKLDNEQLKGIAHAFREKVEEGLNKNNAEIQCIPTFILPKATDVKGKALVLDLEVPTIEWQLSISQPKSQSSIPIMVGRRICRL